MPVYKSPELDLDLCSLSAASTAVADANAAAVTAAEGVYARSASSKPSAYLQDFNGPIAATFYAPIPNNGYLWYPSYNPVAEPYDLRSRPSTTCIYD